MTYTIETIQLTDTARLTVAVDDGPANPRKDWDMLTGFVKIEGRGDSRRIDVEPVHDAPAPIRDAHERIHRSVACAPNCPWGSRHRVHTDEQDVVRWARIFHGLHIEYDSEHGGYWFVDRASWASGWDAPADGFTLERQAEIIEGERETYRQWAEGEVYGVTLERLTEWVKVIDVGGVPTPDYEFTRDDWEEAESLWGCYLDEKYTAQVVAGEHFDLTEEETEALGLPQREEEGSNE